MAVARWVRWESKVLEDGLTVDARYLTGGQLQGTASEPTPLLLPQPDCQLCIPNPYSSSCASWGRGVLEVPLGPLQRVRPGQCGPH